ncbi:unnamed protein product, partial [Allacma fusca]
TRMMAINRPIENLVVSPNQ